MATKIVFRNQKTHPRAIPQDGYRDITVANPAASALNVTTDAVTPDERWFLTTSVPQWFWSERVAAEVTISGEITFAVRGNCAAAFTGRLRCRLYKITAGGSNVETFIGQADAAIDMVPSVSQTYTFSFTPAAPVTMAPNERFICRPSVVAAAGGFGADTAFITCGGGVVSQECSITFTETVTFRVNGVLFFTRAIDSGIGDFYDLSETRNVTPGVASTGVVATVDSGTEIQWMRGAKIATEVAAAAIESTSNAATYASASFTPVANRLYLLGVTHSDAAPESTVPTVTSTTGLAFVQVGNSLPIATIASPGLRFTLFRAMKASGLSAGTFTVTLADAGTGCSACLIEVPNVIATGADGADAVLNVSENSNNASANPSVTMLNAFDDANNATFLFAGCNINTVPTGGTGITVLGHSTNATPTGSVAAAWNSDNDTAPDLVLASSAWAAIAVEVVIDAALIGLLEWISPRVKAPGWTVSALNWFGTFVMYLRESDALANCGVRFKAFCRKPDGAETLIATWSVTTELGTSYGAYNVNNSFGTFNAAVNFAEDDRLVWRAFIIPAAALTMGGAQTCTITYDGITALNTSDCRIPLFDAPEFKAPGDPDADPALLPSRLPMMGA